MSTAAAAFAEAAALLTDRDIRLFERATSFSLQQLVEKVLALNGRELQGVLDLGLGEYGNLYPHALNSNGLHVLKWIIARRIVDSRRAANGWQKHPRYKEFMEKGLLSQKLKHWQPGRSGRVPLTFSELSLIGLASGFSYKHDHLEFKGLWALVGTPEAGRHRPIGGRGLLDDARAQLDACGARL